MTPEEAELVVLGARFLEACFGTDQHAVDEALQGLGGNLPRLADAFTLVAIAAGAMIGDMAQVNLDGALRRLGDSDSRLLPAGDSDRQAAINLAVAVQGDPTLMEQAIQRLDVPTIVNSTFGLAVDAVTAAAQGEETTPLRLAQHLIEAARRGSTGGSPGS